MKLSCKAPGSIPGALGQQGQASLELALLFPLLFILFFAGIQVIIFMQSSAAVQYAAFSSARAFQVYGDRTLGEINYRKLAAHPKTNADQTIAEAAAEMVIFESLMWEQSRIDMRSSSDPLNRVYEDGNDLTYNQSLSQSSGGAVKVNLHCASANGCPEGKGVTVTYCMPFVFPGIDFLFAGKQKQYPCKVERFGRSYNGVALSKTMHLGREPIER